MKYLTKEAIHKIPSIFLDAPKKMKLLTEGSKYKGVLRKTLPLPNKGGVLVQDVTLESTALGPTRGKYFQSISPGRV